MSYHRRDIEKTTAYLCDNADLKTAIGLDENALLEPHYLGVGEHNLNYWFEEVKTEEPVDEHAEGDAESNSQDNREPEDDSPSSSDEPQPERNTKYVLRVNVASQPFHDDL